MERAILVGISRTAKSGFLLELNNVRVFPIHEEEYADKFGFTEDGASVIIHLEEIKKRLLRHTGSIQVNLVLLSCQNYLMILLKNMMPFETQQEARQQSENYFGVHQKAFKIR